MSGNNSEKAITGGIWTWLAITIGVINLFLAFPLATRPISTSDASNSFAEGKALGQPIGQVFGRAVVLPFIFIGLFSIGKGFRNPRARREIFFWVSLLITFATFSEYSHLKKSANSPSQNADATR